MIYYGIKNELLDINGLPVFKNIEKYVEKHADYKRLCEENKKMYEGKHEILERPKKINMANHTLVNNFPAEIVTFTSSYFLGKPISISGDLTDDLNFALKKSLSAARDQQISKLMAVYGMCYELDYISTKNGAHPQISIISPDLCFCVKEQTIEEDIILSCYYFNLDNSDNNVTKMRMYIYTQSTIFEYEVSKDNRNKESDYVLINQTSNISSIVPLYPYKNNEELQCDFETVKTLINAYNTCSSDNMNDISDFVNAVLVLTDAKTGNTAEECEESISNLNSTKILELHTGGDAKWLIKTLDQATITETLKRLDEKIHKFSMVPDLSNENFINSSSGIALKIKLLAIDSKCVEKERLFEESLMNRLTFFKDILTLQNKKVNIDDVDITFTRNLPEDLVYEAQKIKALSDVVSLETALRKTNVVDNVDDELERINEERETISERERKLYNPYPEQEEQ